MNVGRDVVLCEVLLVNDPIPVLSVETVNDFALLIPVTVYSPLKPEPAVPTVKFVLVTLLIVTLFPMESLCGSSVWNSILPEEASAPDKKLKFLISDKLFIVTTLGLN